MLRKVLDAHGGTLPPDVVVAFCNTGRESPETLDFVEACSQRWSVPVTWLEYRHEPWRPYCVVVDHATASRKGEPFDELLRAKKIVPDPTRRFCTEELKVSTLKRHLKSLGWTRWTNVVGLRGDESVRVDKRRAAEAKAGFREPWKSVFPLFDARIEVLDVLKFWRGQPFDLALKSKDGGNCDGCFMKSSAMLGRLFKADPESMQWWIDAEKNTGRGKTFVNGRTYAEIARVGRDQFTLPWDDGAPCDQGCGI